MFNKIFIENEIINWDKTREIINRFPTSEIFYIDKIEDIFQKTKKPYLQKRETLNLFLGVKKGKLVKTAPNAYGLSGEPHYYFVHAYNCIYECDYCYLQGYFHSPDIVLFLNHEEIGHEITAIAAEHLPHKTWFHAGEYSDSLALSHISGEIPFYFALFKNLPHAYLELRTKSINIKELIKQTPLQNIITSFSLAPNERTIKNDIKTPKLLPRLKAIKELHEKNFPIGIHFDPVIYDQNLLTNYENLIEDLAAHVPLSAIRYFSIGVVRFTKDVFHQVKLNYPHSDLIHQEFIKRTDNKVSYNRPMRMWILQKIKEILVSKNVDPQKIYLCMEEEDEDDASNL